MENVNVGDLVLYYNYGTYGFQILKVTPCFVVMRKLKEVSDYDKFYPPDFVPQPGMTWYHHLEKNNFAPEEDYDGVNNVIKVKKTKVHPYKGEIIEWHRHDE